MRDMREEIAHIHDNRIRVKCQNIIKEAESRINNSFSVIFRAKDNLIESAKNALKAFKEHGKETLKNAVNAMKIPEALDKFSSFFSALSKETENDSIRVVSMQSEFKKARNHFSNVMRVLTGKSIKSEIVYSSDKSTISRFAKFLSSLSTGFSSLAQKSMDLSDKLRVDNMKMSVKNDLKVLKGLGNSHSAPDTGIIR